MTETEPAPLSPGEEALYRNGLRDAPTVRNLRPETTSLATITVAEWADRCRRLIATLDRDRRDIQREARVAYRRSLVTQVQGFRDEYERLRARSEIDEAEFPASRSGARQRWAARAEVADRVLRLLTDGAEPPKGETL